MTTLPEPIADIQESKDKENINRDNILNYKYNNNTYPKHVLRHVFKHRCDRILKNKLKKYKLRKNGIEDPDVIDISHTFRSLLKIWSPTKTHLEAICDTEELRPRNYLFKMARRKQKPKLENSGTISPKEKEACVLKDMEPARSSQEKKHTDAFKLMMDSRHKSIGSNSPGKDKPVDPSEAEEILEKKTIKAKRNLALQKMAEAKGALKNKEIEELQDKKIKKKMEKRKERLKDMLVNASIKDSKKDLQSSKKQECKVTKVATTEQQIEIEDSEKSNEATITEKKPTNSIQLVDIFSEILKPTKKVCSEKKIIHKDDEEFLKKLSPSIKKKENMLCYFKKIERKSDGSPDDNEVANESSPIIKVKLSVKDKKRLKKKKLSLHKDTAPDILKESNEKECSNDLKAHESVNGINNEESSCERKKRKRKENLHEVEPVQSEIQTDPIKSDEGRPKRNIKKPVKYTDDVQLSSSDEELHIFTPKKRKHGESKSSNLVKEACEEEIIISDEESKRASKRSKKTENKDTKTQKKATKLAPIFAPKPVLDPEQLEAKQRFLYSGVPDKIKKIIAQQKESYVEVSIDFPVVVHVQQKVEAAVHSPVEMPILIDYSSDEDILTNNPDHLFRNLIRSIPKENPNTFTPSYLSNVTTTLQTMKDLYPKFPVFRTYRLLKNKSKGELRDTNIQDLENSREIINNLQDDGVENPEYLSWTDKYKATSTSHLMGNFESTKELKKWLLSWSENQSKAKNIAKNDSDSSDFYDSDSNSKDCFKSMNNLLILTGPVGCGKTSSVYAVAAELAMKVIEVNASSKRTGKVMLQDLQEATQSHKVNRGGIDNSQKSQELVEVVEIDVVKKRGRPKKSEATVPLKKSSSKDEMQSQPNSSQDARTGMSLILVDDADIVFEQDDGFSSAIAQLAQISKRPVILVTGSLTCPHLQKFVQYGKIIHMNSLVPRISGTWLDIMCLVDNGISWPGLGAKILDYFKGDIRKSINFLQFNVTAHVQNLRLEENRSQSDYKSSTDDENSNTSWADNEMTDERNTVATPVKDEIWNFFMSKHTNLLHLRYPLDLVNIWWNVPGLLNTSKEQELKKCKEVETKTAKQNPIAVLKKYANVLDAFSISDVLASSYPDGSGNITSEPWYSAESDSVSEQEDLNNYNSNYYLTGDIIQELITSSIIDTQRSMDCKVNTDIDFPNVAMQREKDRLVSRHDYLTNIFHPSFTLDRRALALDYWSSCRSICRIEKTKNDTTLKRNNRFCHYLRINSLDRTDSFDVLAESLCFKGKN